MLKKLLFTPAAMLMAVCFLKPAPATDTYCWALNHTESVCRRYEQNGASLHICHGRAELTVKAETNVNELAFSTPELTDASAWYPTDNRIVSIAVNNGVTTFTEGE